MLATRVGTARRARRCAHWAFLIAAAAALGCGDASTGPARGVAGPVGALGHTGRWLTDETGRVVVLHGVNFVQKFPPIAPAAVGFDADDAAFLRRNGFDVVRLGVVFGAVMPSPGEIDRAYVDSIAETTRVLAREEIYVLLDFHQDGYGPLVHGNGFPEWATLTDGLPNPPDPFPTYYVTNPALQRAFDNFWENRPGPDGVPLQTHYATALREVAAAVASEPHVLGYDLMNEPWPGATFSTCLTGCPDIEVARLVPFGERMTAAIREVDARSFVFSEPFVLFNFGQGDTTLSGIGAPASGLSYHVYATSPALDEAVMDRAIAASARGDALLATEFGATTDAATIRRLTSAFDVRLLPWVFWSYDENLVVDKAMPPEGANVRAGVLDALVRPYATATNGTPAAFAYDPADGRLDISWSTLRPDGSPAPRDLVTTVAMPPTAFGEGYAAEVVGGEVVSEPCAPVLAVRNAAGARSVDVHATRTAACAR
ncbi:MAG TPA: cellulase family glycosylhydrolase [Candidatus Binatia bacterium]|nr:cellulase family glycosylhydrolase [Candidatus Binatia bacterium]